MDLGKILEVILGALGTTLAHLFRTCVLTEIRVMGGSGTDQQIGQGRGSKSIIVQGWRDRACTQINGKRVQGLGY